MSLSIDRARGHARAWAAVLLLACLLPVSTLATVTFGRDSDGKVGSLDLEGLGAFQRAPERPR